jgi:uncharacterized protein YegP (UPF0339 family)
MHFEIHCDTDDGYWHWRLVDEAGTVHARSPQRGYDDEKKLLAAIEAVKRAIPGAYTEF